MLKIMLLSALVGVVVFFIIRAMPRLRSYAQRLLQNPIVKAIVFRGIWRLVRLLIFKR